MTRFVRFRNILGRGVVAGVAGTLALSAFELFERRLLGRAPVYAPRHIANRLAARFGVSLTPARSRRLAWAMRCVYGPSLGVAGAWLDPERGSRPRRAMRHGLAISAFELVVLPWGGAVPPLDTWPISEILLLVAHATAFASGAELAALPPRAGVEA
jgi:hypothetical protein